MQLAWSTTMMVKISDNCWMTIEIPGVENKGRFSCRRNGESKTYSNLLQVASRSDKEKIFQIHPVQ